MTPADRAVLDALPENEILALTAFLEARDQPIQGIVGVMWVILNRVQKHHCGRTINEVCLWPKQFSCWNDGDPCQALGMELARQLGAFGRPDSKAIVRHPDSIVLSTCCFLADRVLRPPPKHVPDPTRGATHYYNPHVVTKPPAWAAAVPVSDTTTIGAHKFFRNVA